MIVPAATADEVGRARRSEAGILLRIGIPIGLAQLVQASLTVTDVVMLGRFDSMAMAASAIGSVIYFLTFFAGLGFAMAVMPSAGQSLGADPDDTDTPRSFVQMALLLVALIYPFAFGLHILAPAIAARLGQPAMLVDRLGTFMLALSPGLAFALGSLVLRNFLIVLGRARAPLLVLIGVALLNGLLNYALIYGNLGMPRLGLVGSGLATTLSQAAGFAGLALYSSRSAAARRFRLFRGWRWSRPSLVQLCRLGIPISIAMLFEVTALASIFLAGRIGPDEAAASQIALNLTTVMFMLPYGIGMAGSARIALGEGAGDVPRVRRVGLLTLALAAGLVAPGALVMLTAPEWVVSLYLASGRAGDATLAAAALLPLCAAFVFLDVLQMAANQCLRGLKDVMVPTLVLGASNWLVGFPLAILLSRPGLFGVKGVWIGLIVGLSCAAVILVSRLHKKISSRNRDRLLVAVDGRTSGASERPT